jgi:HlyD family secretion protein
MINNSALVGLGLVFVTAASSCQQRTTLPHGFQGVVEFEERRLGFEFPGKLASLNVDVGSAVKAGDLIASLDDSVERAQRPIRDNEAEAAKDRVQLIKARSRPEEIQGMEARIRAATALEQQLRNNLQREQALLQTGATPRAVSEDLQSQVDRAVAQRQELEQSLKLLLRGARKEEVAQASAQAQASLASIQALEERLSHYRLNSPLAGEVLQIYARVGETVGAGSPVLAVADTSRPYADVFVPQGQIAEFSVGAPVSIRVDSSTETLHGSVEWLGRRTEFTPRFLFSEQERPNLVIRVRVRIDDSQHSLRAGLPAFVTRSDNPVALSH